ncbi:MAG: HD domain-containing phosphohydrolase [Pseudomonadota bacterium]
MNNMTTTVTKDGECANRAERPTILIVEDSPVQAELLRRALQGAGYEVIAAGNGAEGLAMAKAQRPAAVVSDINMPIMDGYAMCGAMRREDSLRATPVMLLTMLSDAVDVVRGLNAGADAYLTKPYNIPALVSRLKVLLAYPPPPPPPVERRKVEVRLEGETYLVDAHGPRILNLLISTYENAVLQNRELVAVRDALNALNEGLESRVREQAAALILEIKQHAELETRLESERRESAEKLQQNYLSTIEAIALALEKRDAYTSGHQRRASELVAAMARELGLAPERTEALRVTGLLYDLGKISVPADIVNRARSLNKSERALIQAHVRSGYEIVKGVKFPWPVAEIVLQHHERLDGSGYPAGLKNGAILLEARILAIADVVEAMCSHRPHRAALGVDAALEEIGKGRGTLYDAEAADACTRLFREKGFAFGQ